MAQSPKIVIVGAGIMGLSCALRLADAGALVEVIDMRTPGEGATLASLGALWPASPLARGALQELHRASLWQFEAYAADVARRSGRPVTVRRLGRLELLRSDKALEHAAEECRAAGAAWPALGDGPVMAVVSAAEIAARWPTVAAAAHGGVVCRATAQVRVAELVAALVVACAGAGVVFRTGARVTGIVMDGAHAAGVEAGGARVVGDVVLVTGGAWTAQLMPEIAAVAPIRPAKGQGLALRIPAGVRVDTIVKSEAIYLVPWAGADGGGEILVGSTTEPEARFDETPTATAREALCAGAAAIVPALAGAEVLRHWAGLRPQNPAKRHPPIMGPHPRIGNLFLCTGHYKTGIGLAPLVSELMRQWILTRAAPAGLVPFQPLAHHHHGSPEIGR